MLLRAHAGAALGRKTAMRWLSELRMVAVMVIPLTLAGCQTTVVGTAHSSYLVTWSQRLDEYRRQFIEKDTQIRAKESVAAANLASDPDPWGRLVSRVFELSIDVREAYEIAGRGEAIKAFLAHMQSNPTPGLSDVWFLRQAEDLQREAKRVDERTQQFFRTFDQKVRQGPDWILEIEQLARDQGLVAGKAGELQSLNKQALSYYLDQRSAQQQDQYRAEQQARAADTLLAVGAYLSQLNYQQQLLNTLNRPRTCTFSSNSMACY